jgi:hypothetical protein
MGLRKARIKDLRVECYDGIMYVLCPRVLTIEDRDALVHLVKTLHEKINKEKGEIAPISDHFDSLPSS